MRNLLAIGLVLGAMLPALAQDKSHLEFTITGAGGQTIYLANYLGNRLYYNDTAVADANGKVVFAKARGYKPGIYAVMVGPKRFEVAVNEPMVRITTDLADLDGKLTVVESRENQLFREQRKINAGTVTPAGEEQLRAIVRENPGTMVAMIVKMGLPTDHAVVKKADGSPDSAATASLYLAHYWDNTDLHDERILQTPVFQNKLDEFIGRDVPQVDDSINHYMDDLIARTGGSGEVFTYILGWVTTKYETTGAQDMDAVYVHMAQKYVCTGQHGEAAPAWKPADKWTKVCMKAREKEPLMLGGRSRDLILADTSAQHWISMHKMPQECIILVFWSPHCSHCKQAMPALYKEYTEKLKTLDVGVYAVADAVDSSLFADWKTFVRENALDWVNVGLPWRLHADTRANPGKYVPKLTTVESLNYTDSWKVTATPKFYVLDGERRIIGKPTSIKEIVDMVKAHKERAH